MSLLIIKIAYAAQSSRLLKNIMHARPVIAYICGTKEKYSRRVLKNSVLVVCELLTYPYALTRLIIKRPGSNSLSHEPLDRACGRDANIAGDARPL